MTLRVHTGFRPGAIGRIVALHVAYCHRLAGFRLPLEARVAREMCDFCERYERVRLTTGY